jgi:hypothetical protein
MPTVSAPAKPAWLTAEQVIDRLGVCLQTLSNWNTLGCPYRSGRKLRTKPSATPGGGRLYLAADIEQIEAVRPLEDEYQDERGTWLSIKRATFAYPFTQGSLEQWARDGCPLLRGKKPRTKWFTGRTPGQAGHARALYLLREDLDAINAAKAAGVVYGEDGGRWPSADEVRGQFGFNRQQLNTWRDEGCPFIRGAKLRTGSRTVLMKDGRPRHIEVYCIEQLEQIRNARAAVTDATAGANDSPGVPFQEAERLFGFKRGWLYDWNQRGCPYLGGRKLRGWQEPVNIDGRVRDIWVYDRAQLEEIDRQRQVAEKGIYRDGEGEWLSARAAEQRYRTEDGEHRIRGGKLSLWREKGCPRLGGRKIRARRKERLTRGKKRTMIWIYHNDDLEQIARGGETEGRQATERGRDNASARAQASAARDTAADGAGESMPGGPLPQPPHPVHDERTCGYVQRIASLLETHLHSAGDPPATEPRGFVPSAEDITILRVLADAGRALIVSAIVREAANRVYDRRKARGSAANLDDGVEEIGETTVRDRLPILEREGLVGRPSGADGKPTQRKGVGITDKGRGLLRQAAPRPANPSLNQR